MKPGRLREVRNEHTAGVMPETPPMTAGQASEEIKPMTDFVHFKSGFDRCRPATTALTYLFAALFVLVLNRAVLPPLR